MIKRKINCELFSFYICIMLCNIADPNKSLH